MDDDLDERARALGERLLALRLQLVTAESCTGGWIAKVVTDIPGSSGWFERGLVTYSNGAKQALLGVPEETLATHGAVSEAVVRAMVAGLLDRTPGDLALAVSGIAGPGGGSPGKPVGTVWFGWGRRGGEPVTRCERLPGDRDAVRRAAAAIALDGAFDLVG